MNVTNKKLDTIDIRIPCNPEYAQLVRLAVASIASRMNFSLDEIEKLKAALSIICNYFALKPQQKTVELSLNIYPKKLIVSIDRGEKDTKTNRKMLEKLITTLLINHYIDNFKLSKKIYLEKQIS